MGDSVTWTEAVAGDDSEQFDEDDECIAMGHPNALADDLECRDCGADLSEWHADEDVD